MNPDDTLVARFWRKAEKRFTSEHIWKCKMYCSELIDETLRELEEDEKNCREAMRE